MKIYTRTGDDGSTARAGGKRLSKSSPLIECTGAIDELNAAIGLALSAAASAPPGAVEMNGDAASYSSTATPIASPGAVAQFSAAASHATASAAPITERLLAIQSELFVLGAQLSALREPDPAEDSLKLKLAASPFQSSKSGPALPPLADSIVARLEADIDHAEALLPPLHNFILPGGSELSARLHLARTICRRAERTLVAFHEKSPISPILIVYLNRLSDWLFVYARWANQIAGVADVIWKSHE